MTEINRVLRRATGRLMLEELFRALVVWLLVASCVVVAARLGERFLAYTMDWQLAWLLAGGVGVIAAVIWTIATRKNRLAVARVVDERAGLKEAISTALCVERSEDAWSRAARDHAQEVSRRVVMRDVVPVRAPRGWFMPLVAVGVFFALGLVPQSDLLGLSAERKEKEEQQKDVLQAEAQEQEAAEILAKVDALLDVGDEAGMEDEPVEPEVPEMTDPMDIRRSAMAKLTSAQERLDQLQNGEESKTLDSMKDLMEQLKQPGPGPLNEMMKSLQQGNFEQAQKQLSELAEKVASGEMTEEQKKQMQEQLKNLAEQLAELAQKQGDLEKKLEELGLDKELAKNPQAMQQALQQAQHLTPEQKQMLEQMAKSQSQSQSMCQNMSSACSGAAGGMSPEDMNLDQMSQLADQMGALSDLEKQQAMAALQQAAIEAKLAELSQCMGQCEGSGLGNKMSDKYSLNKPSGDRRGRGAGDSDEAATDFSTNKEKVKGANSDDNVILGSQFVQGEQVRGESRAQFADAVKAASASASEEIENNQIPREFHEAIKKYFGALEESAKDAPVSKESAAPPAPASDSGN
ncbi:MAG: hypothetical protein KDA16_09855 [Phycisphaerales bacterium]|nr:hypothetical protein [Phycisphaerales bacterium]